MLSLNASKNLVSDSFLSCIMLSRAILCYPMLYLMLSHAILCCLMVSHARLLFLTTSKNLVSHAILSYFMIYLALSYAISCCLMLSHGISYSVRLCDLVVRVGKLGS